jgi:hypothetical protein
MPLTFNSLLDYHYLFYEDSLTDEELKTVAIVCSIILTFVGFFGVIVFDDLRKRSWTISLLNSFLLMCFGIYYSVAVMIPKYPDVLLLNGNYDIYYGRFNAGCIALIWFLLANVFDLIFGILFYVSILIVCSIAVIVTCSNFSLMLIA